MRIHPGTAQGEGGTKIQPAPPGTLSWFWCQKPAPKPGSCGSEGTNTHLLPRPPPPRLCLPPAPGSYPRGVDVFKRMKEN